MRPVAAALIGMLSLLVAAPSLAEQAGDPVFNVASGDAAMAAAIGEARATLPVFLDNALQPGGVGQPNALLKIALETGLSDPTHEHIWVSPFEVLPNGTVRAVLANAPVHLAGKEQGSLVLTTRKAISDWGWFDADGHIYGGYTLRVIRDSGQAPGDPMMARLSSDPLPAHWAP